jgi:hypothetical protein
MPSTAEVSSQAGVPYVILDNLTSIRNKMYNSKIPFV